MVAVYTYPGPCRTDSPPRGGNGSDGGRCGFHSRTAPWRTRRCRPGGGVSGPRPGLASAAQPGGLRPWRGWPRFLAPGARGSPSEELVSRLCPWRWADSLAGWSGALVWDSLAPEAPSRVFVRSPRQNLWASHLPKCYLKTLVLVSNTTEIAYFRPSLNTRMLRHRWEASLAHQLHGPRCAWGHPAGPRRPHARGKPRPAAPRASLLRGTRISVLRFIFIPF